MPNAILIHGWGNKNRFYDQDFPTASNSHWFPWLSKQLMIRDIHTVALEMPKSYYPQYDVWKKELERFDINENTILIGHSCGGGFLVRRLSENDVRVGKVILVAPWLGVFSGDDLDKDTFDASFFDFEIDTNLVKKTNELTIFHSTNDMQEIADSVAILKEKLSDFRYIELENKGHFTRSGLGREEFPKLLEEAIR